MLASIDLFTGMGGFTLALEGIATPLLYCERDPDARAVLEARMRDGHLPRAPVVKDVRNVEEITRITARRRIDIVSAGFPCVGFSSMGARQGLDDDQSGLFEYLVEIVRLVRPATVFMENVADIVRSRDGSDFERILRSFERIGYDTRWTICAAADVGAPHRRKRWFGLCVRKDAPQVVVTVQPSRCPWEGRVPRLVREPVFGSRARLKMLGNGVVPLAARLAFLRCLSATTIDAVGDLRTRRVVRLVKCRGRLLSRASVACTKPACITVDPSHYMPRKGHEPDATRVTTPIVELVEVRRFLPTPRASQVRHTPTLTKRSALDLPTVAMHVSRFGKYVMPRTNHTQEIDPRFVEWMMGYPKDWTRT